MPTALIIILAVVWYAIGLASFVYWWTNSFDLTRDIVPVAFLAALLGPGAFILGSQVNKNSYPEYNNLGMSKYTIVRKRTRPREMDWGARQKYNL